MYKDLVIIGMVISIFEILILCFSMDIVRRKTEENEIMRYAVEYARQVADEVYEAEYGISEKTAFYIARNAYIDALLCGTGRFFKMDSKEYRELVERFKYD